METIKLEYSKPLIKRSIKDYWWRQVGPLFLAVAIFMIGFLIYRIVQGDRSWLVGLVGAIVIMAVVIMVASYVVHLKRSLSKLGSMGKPEATLELEDNRFRISSGAGSSEVEWSLITKVWCFNETWLLFFSAGEFMTLPIKNISNENKKYILSKFEKAGAKVA
ncbi:YcxB family protein [Gilvimarinus polysaccharolyticus]|uniref:YcxB family protein n=1 Tax=Gilvimarinus polysaccharolyticus TaxID=863921 RepID=UPI0018DE2994|nr:YcxB family protein [Gilvimarinus polysaccharolyticus]